MEASRSISLKLAGIGVFVGVCLASLSQWTFRADESAHAATLHLSNGTHRWEPTVLMISLDGLKPEYLNSGHLPNLLKLSQGHWPTDFDHDISILAAESMIPVCPSLTFPNHWSIQTGLQPSSHGIIANDFHAPSLNSSSSQPFYYTDPSRSWDAKWWKGTSIWEQLESVGLRTANLMWPGPPITLNNISSTYFQKYEKGWTLQNRLDKITSWLDEEDQRRPRFLCAYSPDVDSVTHSFGPDLSNKDITSTLRSVDDFLMQVLNEINRRNASSIVNVILVSDHGMTFTSNNRLVYLDDLLGQSIYSQIQFWDGWPNVGLRFENKTVQEQAWNRLVEVTLNEGADKFTIAKRDELIKLWNWEMTETVAERVAEIWILPEVGWSITTREEMNNLNHDYRPRGNHGYHANNTDMSAFFLALGPAIRQNRKLSPFSNLEVHNLVMDLLQIKTVHRAANNGTLGFWDKHLTFPS